MTEKSSIGQKRKKMKTIRIPLRDWLFVEQYCGDEKYLYEGMHDILTDYRNLAEEFGGIENIKSGSNDHARSETA